MRGYAFLLATAVTLGYGFAAQAAMTRDRVGTPQRLVGEAAPVPELAEPGRVWYGGVLAPVTVEANREVARTTTAKQQSQGRCPGET